MDLSWTIEECDGLCLVAIRVSNPATVPRRVRLRNRLDGPVLPPRRNGVTEPPFDADGVTIGVDPEGEVAVGFACPADPEDPPVDIESIDRVQDASDVTTGSVCDRARSALGEFAPPRKARPSLASRFPKASHPPVASLPSRESGHEVAADTEGDERDRDESDSDDGERKERDSDDGERVERDKNESDSDGRNTDERDGDECGGNSRKASGKGSPEYISMGAYSDSSASPWIASPDQLLLQATRALETIETRVERGERLTTPSVADATSELEHLGGLEGLEPLSETIDEDASTARELEATATAVATSAEELAERADALADRATAVDIPIDAFRRLA